MCFKTLQRITDWNRCFWFTALILALWTMLLPLSSARGSEANPLKAEGTSDSMPIGWEQAYQKIIQLPENSRLEKGEILGEVKKVGDHTILAQTLGMVKARAEDCFKVAKSYPLYARLMPCTVENKVIRSFPLEGGPPGLEAVDFWTRVKVLGFNTRYLLRIAHLADPQKHRYRSFWTLVDRPDQLKACRDQENQPCQNDLSINLGSHLFEPFPGNPQYTLHTYTLKLSAEGWLRRSAIRLGGIHSMKEVTQAIRKALER
ncbi:MAG: hypothetical protein AB1585_02330 [Thermodesulfobacteriota bacterium]